MADQDGQWSPPALWLTLCALLLLTHTFAQAQEEHSKTGASDQTPPASTTTLKGCLRRGSAYFELDSIDSEKSSSLWGDWATLTRLVGKEVSVLAQLDNSRQPPIFNVLNIEDQTPKAILNSRFASKWRSEKSKTYGIKFAYPSGRVPWRKTQLDLEANFSTTQAEEREGQTAMTIADLEIPQEVYPHTNFLGGTLSIIVDPKIESRASCDPFGTGEPAGSITFGKRSYTWDTDSSAAMGTGYTGHYFHVYQNGLCYEFLFEFAESSVGNFDLGCTIPVVTEEDELNVIRPVMRRVSFFRPAFKPESNGLAEK